MDTADLADSADLAVLADPADPPDLADPAELERQLEAHRAELTGYCYRMLASVHDAEDAVQETLLRAWRGAGGFAGRSSLRTWLYRIATNACLDALAGRARRALPVDVSAAPSPPVEASLGVPRPATAWVEPIPDARTDPADRAVERDSVRLALVAALQHLPPRQRAVLVLREVLRWRADEVADLLGTTTASVNSALQRARATLAALDLTDDRPDPLDPAERALLDRYVAAFEAYDMASLVALLHEDATMCMPPYALWLRGPTDVAAWMTGPGSACEGSRLVPVRANGAPAFAQYKPSADGRRLEPWSLIVLAVRDGPRGPLITAITHFLDTSLFAAFGVPPFLALDPAPDWVPDPGEGDAAITATA